MISSNFLKERFAIEKSKRKFYRLFCYLLIISIVNAKLLMWLNATFFHQKSATPWISTLSLDEIFVAAIIIAPLVETILFQLLPIYILRQIGIKQGGILVFLSATLFALTHLSFPIYAINAFIVGIFLAYLFIRAEGGYIYASVITMLFHALYNLLLILSA